MVLRTITRMMKMTDIQKYKQLLLNVKSNDELITLHDFTIKSDGIMQVAVVDDDISAMDVVVLCFLVLFIKDGIKNCNFEVSASVSTFIEEIDDLLKLCKND